MKRLILCLFALGVLTLGSCGGGPNPVVVIETSMGDIKVELDQGRAPITVKNFLQYVDDKHYDGTVFHRVISNFMIQGGGFNEQLEEKPTREPIKNESNNGLSNKRGTIAMARTSDPDSASAQFYINVQDNDGLDRNPRNPGGYAVFGKVIAGMDVVDQIREVETGARKLKMRLPSGKVVEDDAEDVPLKNVVIKSVRRVEPK